MSEAKEEKMARAEEERKAVGLTPDKVRELNRTKESKFKSKSKINAAVNVLAASLTAAAGTTAFLEGTLTSQGVRL